MNRQQFITGFAFFIFVAIAFVIILGTSPELTGYTIYVPDYDKYENDTDAKVLQVLSEKRFYEQEEYIISLENYSEDYDSIVQKVGKNNIESLEFIDAVKVKTRKGKIFELLDKEIADKVSLDEKVELLRTSALQTLNISTIRNLGPASFNKTGYGVKVAIIDTGIDADHSEFNCNVGADDCIIKKFINIVNGTSQQIADVGFQDQFKDFSRKKILNLTAGENNVTFKLFSNHTITSAYIYLNQSASGTINGESLIPSSTINLGVAMDPSQCNTSNDYCDYTIIFDGSGVLEISSLEVNYVYYTPQKNHSAFDDQGHGTAVAGVVAETVPNVSLYIYKAMDSNGAGTTSDIIEAVYQAIIDDVDILSLSLGIPRDGGACENTLLEQIVDQANAQGIQVISASGNDAGLVYMPACFDSSLAISSIDDSENPSSFSSTGSEVDFTMPGEDITTTYPGDSYTTTSGTSFSTPFASGVFAFISSYLREEYGIYPSESDLYILAERYATDVHLTGRDDQTGFGYLKPSAILSGIEDGEFFVDRSVIYFNNSKLDDEVFIYSTISQNTPVTVEWSSISVGAGQIELLVNGSSSPLTFNDSLNMTIEIMLNTSPIQAIEVGNYSTLINISTENSSYLLNVSYEELTGMNEDIAGNNFTVYLFSASQSGYAYQLSTNGSFVYENTTDVTQYNCAVSLNTSAMSNCSSQVEYDVGDYIVPWLVTDENFSSYNSVSLIINSSNESITLPLYTNVSGEFYSTNTTSLYPFTLEGDYSDQSSLDSLLETNFHRFLTVSEYNVTLALDSGTSMVYLSQGSISVISNLTIELNDSLLFSEEQNQIDLHVMGINNISLVPTVAPYTQATTLYGNFSYTTELNSTLFTLTQENDSFYYTPGSELEEGLYLLAISINQSSNNTSVAEYNESIPVSIINRVQSNLTLNGSTVSSTENATATLSLSKEGENATALVYFTLSESCASGIALSTTNTTINLSSTPTNITTLLYENQTDVLGTTCVLSAEVEVTGTCYHCVYANESTTTYAYNLSSNVSFTKPGATYDLDYSTTLSDTNTRIGEYIPIIFTITNNEAYSFMGNVSVTSTTANFSGVTSQLATVSANSSENVTFTFYATSSGTKELTFSVNNSGTIQNTTAQATLSSDLLSITVAKNETYIYSGDQVKVLIAVRNSNDEQQEVTNSFGNYESLFSLVSQDSATKIAAPSGTADYSYVLTATTPGTVTLTGNYSSDEFTSTWTFPITVESGSFQNISISDSLKTYTIGINDTLGFVVDNQCEDVYDSCTDRCEDEEDMCEDTCSNYYNRAKQERDSCRASCNDIVNNDDRDDCEDDCDNVFDQAKDDRDDCREECTDDGEDCIDYCADDLDDCIDDSAEVRIRVEDFDEGEIELEIESENDYSLDLEEGDSEKLDLDDDGYYETEIILKELVEQDGNSCEDICDASRDSARDVCEEAKTTCDSGCDDADCRDDCREDRNDCRDDSDDDYDDCMDDCEPSYVEYEIKIQKIDPEDILPVNLTPEDPDDDETNTTTPPPTSGGGSGGSDDGNNETNTTTPTNETNTTTPPVEVDDPYVPPGNNPPPVESNDSIDECSGTKLEFCTSSSDCISNGGYWYNEECNAFPEEVVIDPEPTTPPPQDTITIPDPSVETPGSASGSFPVQTVAIIFFALVLLGGGVVGYVSFAGKGNSPFGNSSSPEENNGKGKKLQDYIVKQMEKGHNSEFIKSSLINLGWDAQEINEAITAISLDPSRRLIVQMVRFALQNNVRDKSLLQQQFPTASPPTIEEAMNHLQNHSPK